VSTPRRSDPEPLEYDEVRVVAVGTAAFALALLVSLVLRDRLVAAGNESWSWIFLAGSLLGLIGLRHVRRRRARRSSVPVRRPSPPE
jgi:MFS family permease